MENMPMAPRHILTVIVVVATLLATPMVVAAAEMTVTGSARISDGDTITVQGTKIRLNGIDAPETDQVCINTVSSDYACGILARDALVQLIGGRPLVCTGNEIDRYGRRVMTCRAGETDINAAMVAGGWALAFRRYSDIYAGQEEAARGRKVGLWSGAFIAPWDWRRRGSQTEILGALSVPIDAQQRLLPQPLASTNPTSSCRIKGNISRNGTRIYHVPGQQDYERTMITERKGERWFCTENEAQAAGWRRARN
jgi:endonuclease YncB( thermonuclease family)